MNSIEILGPWLLNKGDELMLRSVIDQMESNYRIGVSTDLKMEEQKDLQELPRLTFQPKLSDFQYALRQKSVKNFLSVVKRGLLLPLAPQWLLQKFRYINGKNFVALFDCSGFAYGDQWSPNRLISRTKYYRKLREKGVTLIMLPQALGPFKDPEIKIHAEQMLSLFDFIFPREATSRQHVLDLGIDVTKVKSCPDVSHLLNANPPAQSEEWASRVVIVPNARMLDKTDPAIAKSYLDYLVICIERVIANNLEPVILLHETNDDKLVDQLLNRLNFQPEVFDEDGIISKGYLGVCYANFGSRYHSLVSSLSQATPSLGTSWAHKYEELFSEYGCEDCLVSPDLDEKVITKKIDDFLLPERNKQLRRLLQKHADIQKEKVKSMWEQVERIISAKRENS